jgi:hypothetical protein
MSIRVEVEAHGRASSHALRTVAASLATTWTDDCSISAYQRAGVEHVVLALNTGDIPRITELMQDIAKRVMPQFR